MDTPVDEEVDDRQSITDPSAHVEGQGDDPAGP
jgi:hypothetical protein